MPASDSTSRGTTRSDKRRMVSMMNPLRHLRLPVVLSVILAVAGCEEKLKPSVVVVNQEQLPSQESWNSTVVFTDSARLEPCVRQTLRRLAGGLPLLKLLPAQGRAGGDEGVGPWKNKENDLGCWRVYRQVTPGGVCRAARRLSGSEVLPGSTAAPGRMSALSDGFWRMDCAAAASENIISHSVGG